MRRMERRGRWNNFHASAKYYTSVSFEINKEAGKQC